MPNTSIDYFDQMYRRPDPWDYESSWYEQRKYALTLAALRRERYENGFEPGCSIGVLTELLAPRCRHLLAADFHDGALARAHARSGDPAVISGYMGKGRILSRAIADFAVKYADQNEADHARLIEAVREGTIEARFEEA